jgi:hypothetical protein
LQRHRPDHQREHRVGVWFEGRDIGPEILGVERRPDFLDDLAATVLEGLLKAAGRLVAERIIGGDGDDLLIALVAGPLAERVVRLRARPTGADEIGIIAELASGSNPRGRKNTRSITRPMIATVTAATGMARSQELVVQITDNAT